MKVEKTIRNGVLTVTVEGEINTVTTPLLMKEVEDLSGISRLVFDIDKVRYVSSAGLRMFLSCRRAMDSSDGDMIIINCSEFVAETFASVGYNRIIKVETKEAL